MDRLLITIFIISLLIGSMSNNTEKSASSNQDREPGYGTTRAPSYQRAYEEAVKEYDRKMMVLSPGLILPCGETVQEHIDSGHIYIK